MLLSPVLGHRSVSFRALPWALAHPEWPPCPPGKTHAQHLAALPEGRLQMVKAELGHRLLQRACANQEGTISGSRQIQEVTQYKRKNLPALCITHLTLLQGAICSQLSHVAAGATLPCPRLPCFLRTTFHQPAGPVVRSWKTCGKNHPKRS